MIELLEEQQQIDEYEMILEIHKMLYTDIPLKSTQQAFEQIKNKVQQLQNITPCPGCGRKL